MSKTLAQKIIDLKTEFVKIYDRNNHLYEAIPSKSSDSLPINPNDLKILHNFAKNNPIYSNSFEIKIKDVDCIVYEGDINNYWLDSIKHDTSYAPFYPTWILSAYVLAKESKKLGMMQAVDIGSGDGRIAYCCQMMGIKSYGIEIDENLAELQKNIAIDTDVKFTTILNDATKFNYPLLNLNKSIFFIGGLPQIGEILANSVIKKIKHITKLEESSVFVLTGVNQANKVLKNIRQCGWEKLIQDFNLDVISIITLPTRWTVEQPVDTPYVFTTHR